MRSNCLTCGEPLQHAERGRHRDYCSIACRRAQEGRKRRLNVRLDRVSSLIAKYQGKPSAWGDHQLPRLISERDSLIDELNAH